MKLLAWLYMRVPEWMIRLLPDKVNYTEEGKFNEAVEAAYDAIVDREYRKNVKKGKGK